MGAQMRRFGSVGLFAEQAVERAHHQDNEESRQFQAVRGWSRKRSLMRIRKRAQGKSVIQRAVRHVKMASKRRFSELAFVKKEGDRSSSFVESAKCRQMYRDISLEWASSAAK